MFSETVNSLTMLNRGVLTWLSQLNHVKKITYVYSESNFSLVVLLWVLRRGVGGLKTLSLETLGLYKNNYTSCGFSHVCKLLKKYEVLLRGLNRYQSYFEYYFLQFLLLTIVTMYNFSSKLFSTVQGRNLKKRNWFMKSLV